MKFFAKLLLALTLAFTVAAPASAQLLLTKVGPGGFGSAQFVVANSALLTPEYSISLPAATLPSTGSAFDLSVWIRCQGLGTVATAAVDKTQGCFNAIPIGNFADVNCPISPSAETNPGLNIVYAESPAAGGQIRFNVNNSTCDTNNSALRTYTGSNVLSGGAWHHLRWVGDVACTPSANVKCSQAWLDGVSLFTGLNDIGVWALNKTIAFNVNPFYINAWNTSASTGQAPNRVEIAQFCLDLTASPMQASSNTPVNPIGNFISGGLPKDAGAGCTNFFGHTATIALLNPPASFTTNTGSLGTNFSVNGKVSNTITNQAYAAPFNPGETPDRPYVKWSYSTKWNGVCANTTLTCSPVRLNSGNPIAQGDLLCVFINVSLASGSANDAFSMAGSGYTTVIATMGTANTMNHATFCKTAGAGDVTAAGSDWTSPTWTWANNGAAFSLAAATVVDFGKYGAAGTTPTVNVSGAATAANGSLPYPTLTSPTGLSLWFGSTTSYDYGFVSASAGPAATGTLIWRLPRAVAGNDPMMVVEKLSASASIVRTAQQSAAEGNPTIATVLILN